MTKAIANVEISTFTFNDWVTKTNEIADAVSTVVVTANATLSNTTGNAYVNGTIAGNTVVVTTNLKGGSVSGSTITTANLDIASAVVISNTLYATSANIAGGIVANSSVVKIPTTVGINANGSIGTSGQLLASNGTSVYWANASVATGYTGSRGDTGYTGSKGTDGVVGYNGSTGFTGSKGDVGFTGSRGDTGYTGSAGTNGFVGSVGYTGSAGVNTIPSAGAAKTTSYTLATGDVGEFVEVGTGGSIVIPNATFSAGDTVLVWNNTTGTVSVTCSITTAYIAGVDSDKSSVTIPTRGVMSILFANSTVCILSGSVY